MLKNEDESELSVMVEEPEENDEVFTTSYKLADCYAIVKLRVFKKVLSPTGIHGDLRNDNESYCSTVFSLDGNFKEEIQSLNEIGDQHVSSAEAVVDSMGGVKMVVYQNRRIIKRELTESAASVKIRTAAYTMSHEESKRSGGELNVNQAMGSSEQLVNRGSRISTPSRSSDTFSPKPQISSSVPNGTTHNGGFFPKDPSPEPGLAESMEPLRNAFYNVTVFLMAICFILGIFAAYFLFYDFVKPMTWAIITGIILFPLKRKLAKVVKGWLDSLNEARTPLTMATLTLPFSLTIDLGDFILDLGSKNLKAVLLLGASFPACSLILYYETVPKVLVFAKKFVQNIDSVVCIFRGKWVPALLIVYLAYIVVTGLISTGHVKQLGFLRSSIVSWTLWIATLAYGCGYFGPFGTPVFAVILILCSTYYFMPELRVLRTMSMSQSQSSVKGSPRKYPKSRSRSSQSNTEDVRKEPLDESVLSELTTISEQSDTETESNLYLKYLFMACFFVWISLHLWMMFLLLIPIGLAALRRIALAFEVAPTLTNQVGKLSKKLDNECDILLPPPLRHLLNVVIHIDSQIIYWLRQSMDMVGSFAAMFLLVIAVAGLSGFVVFQLYYESLHLINLTASIANQTLTNNLAFQNWLKQTANVDSITQLTDQAVQKAYDLGRGWLSAHVHEIITNDEEKAKLLETQIVSTLDSFFNSWMKRNESSTALITGQQKSAIAHWADVWTALDSRGSDWNLFDDLQEYMTVAWSLAESAWLLVKSNMEVLLVGLSQMMSTIIASGSAVVDFFLDSIVYFTFLVFLLSSSDDEYKPMKMIRELVPSGRAVAVRITEEVEQAVSGVFLATFKMALFYGMFTWLTHTLFAVNIVFIPSVLAAVFAAIPFFGTYIVATPAILELWLVRGEPFLAILLFVLHYLPGYFVDDAIYSEIRLTTPFLTGMAIAGGMLWWGLEGAIFGPLVLCCLLVIGSMYTDVFFRQVSSTE